MGPKQLPSSDRPDVSRWEWEGGRGTPEDARAAETREKRHLNARFEADLRALKEQMLAMGRLVDTHVDEAVAALVGRDPERARNVVLADSAVNQLELAIDEQCIRMLVLHQPAASDLRFIAASLKMVTDLERIGDLAVNMAERVPVLASEPPLQSTAELPAMAAAAQKNLRDVLGAFVAGDSVRAEAVIAADPLVDAWMARLFDQVRAEMRDNPATIDAGLATIFFGKQIERMGDHSTNVAEMVIYLVRGQDVRHAHGRPAGE